jgi:predicted ATPase/DNA-binding SARP family transcriptional activator
MGLEIAILGPLEPRSDGAVLHVPAGKQRALLCLLAVRAPHPVAAEVAAEALWPESPPAEATRSLQVTVSRLRRSLAPAGAPVETLASGYRLAVADEAIDARRFEALVERARAARAHDAPAARRLLDDALALWRGPALADAAFEGFAQGEIARLEELRLVALEERLDLRLAGGDATLVVGELEQLAAEHPSRERLVGLLMLALYRGGRQADALEAYSRARRRMDEELGLEPSVELQQLQGAILRQDASLTAAGAGESPPEGVVTMLFSDIEGSTRLARAAGSLWPRMLAEHHQLVVDAVEQAGGHIDGSEGDAVFAYFVDPSAALEAASAAQHALRSHAWPEPIGELRVRMGVHAGLVDRAVAGYSGLEVHMPARVMAAGHGGQVVVSAAARALLGSRPDLVDMGEHRLKDFPAPERLWLLVHDERGPGDFPPLRTEPVRTGGGTTTNLPHPLTRLLGRDREAVRVAELLVGDDGRLVSLTGPGGVGKTRLALHVARELLSRFEAVFLVDLAAVRDPALVVPAVAAALGVREGGGSSVADALVRELGDRDVLLVLDNVEQVIAAAAALGDLLARTRGLRLLVTSRTPLRLAAERVILVEPLAAVDAADLFVERAGAAGHDAAANAEDAAAVPAICSQLDGLPLAIELAAARTQVLPPRALLRRLHRRLELLTVGARDADTRHGTLLAALDWSHDLLNERERRLLRRLAVFARGFTAEAAEEVCRGAAVLDGLAALVEHSLLRRDVAPDGEPRFAMLETVREYATGKLRASTEDLAVHARHADYMAALAERAEPDALASRDTSAFDLLEVEHDNLRAALDWAHATARHDLELRLAGALWWFWFLRGHWTEGLARLDAALGPVGATAGPARAKALRGRGLLRVRRGLLAEAEADGRELLALAEDADDEGLRAQALEQLARVVHTRGDYEQARRLYEEVASLSRRTGDTTLVGIALDVLADVALNESRFQDAATLAGEALEIGRAAAHVERVASSLDNLGSALLGLGRIEEAAEHFTEALRRGREIRDAEATAYALEGLGAVTAAIGHPKRAARLLGAAGATLTALGTDLQDFEAHRHQQIVAQLHDELGNQTFAAAWTEGQAMTPDDATALALSEPARSGRRAQAGAGPPTPGSHRRG